MKTLATSLELLISRLPRTDEPAKERARNPVRRTMRECDTEELAVMIAEYVAGATLREVAEAHGYNRMGVSAAFKKVGVELRRSGLNQVQVGEAVHLYENGCSLATVAARFGVDAGTVRSHLLRRGVEMRPASGR